MFLRNSNLTEDERLEEQRTRDMRARAYSNRSPRLPRLYRRRTNWSGFLVATTFVVVILGAFIVNVVVPNTNEQVLVACVVEDKDRTRTENGSDMRVYTENCGVLQVGDNWIQGVFASADIYASIKPGETYNFTTVGYRFGLLSMFPNIIKVEQV